MPRPDEGLIHTWLDGESTPDEAARIERLVATDPEWAAAVAEARGLIAASSRIVTALDHVPAAMPPGTRAAPTRGARRGFRVPAWMGMAAALVLVAGTAYVLREQANEPFAPLVTAEPAASPPPAPTPTADSVAPPATVDATSQSAPRRESGGAGATTQLRSEAPAPQPAAGAAAPAVPTPTAQQAKVTEEQAKAAAEAATAEREWRLSRSAVRQAAAPPPRQQAFSLADAAPMLLEGCWRVTAPPAEVGILRDPPILAQRGDSLLLRTLRDTVWVRLAADRLQGGVEAQREPCAARSP